AARLAEEAWEGYESLKGQEDSIRSRVAEALRLDRENMTARALRGMLALAADRDSDGAYADLEYAVPRVPEKAMAWYYLGMVRERRHDTSGALEAFETLN